MTFSDDKTNFLQAINDLTLHQGRTHYPTPFPDGESAVELEPTDTPREKFLVNLKICLLWLMADQHQHQPWSNLPLARVQPAS